jgi:hypothetical protein
MMLKCGKRWINTDQIVEVQPLAGHTLVVTTGTSYETHGRDADPLSRKVAPIPYIIQLDGADAQPVLNWLKTFWAGGDL